MKTMLFFILLNLVFSSIIACGSLKIGTKVTTPSKKSNLVSKKTSSNGNNNNDNDKNVQCNWKLSSKDEHSIGLPPSKTEMGHTIIFDYKRIRDDKVDKNYKGNYTSYFDCELELGSKTVIDTFEEALVGHTPGKEFMITIDATFKPGIYLRPPVWETYKIKIQKIIKW